jgi:hypothetical protein
MRMAMFSTPEKERKNKIGQRGRQIGLSAGEI